MSDFPSPFLSLCLPLNSLICVLRIDIISSPSARPLVLRPFSHMRALLLSFSPSLSLTLVADRWTHPRWSLVTVTLYHSLSPGVDLAALYAADECGVPYSGWVPLHYTNETGEWGIPERFRRCLLETATAGSAERTERNIEEADAILTLTCAPRGSGHPPPSSPSTAPDPRPSRQRGPDEKSLETLSPGTQHGIEYATERLGVPRQRLRFVDLDEYRESDGGGSGRGISLEDSVRRTVDWIESLKVQKCAIGGPRESEVPGIQDEAHRYLVALFSKLLHVGTGRSS